MQVVAKSKLTAKEQLTLPAAIRKMLGVEAGDELVWKRDNDGRVVVEPARKYTLADIRAMLDEIGAPRKGKAASVRQMKQGIRKHIREKHGIR